MTKIYPLILLIFIFSKANAQVNYTFSAATGTYTSIAGTSPTLQRGFPDAGVDLTDEGYANGIPIGFSFNYNGTAYTTLSVNTNGFIAFKDMTAVVDVAQEGYYADDLANGPYIATDVRPVIAPFWNDLDIGAAANLRYLTSGTAPNRVFTMEWANVFADWTASSPVLSFQVKLYEGSNLIEFIYRAESGTYSHAGETNGASIGLTGTARGQFLSVQNNGATPTASTTANMDSIKTKPITGQIFRFTPTGSFPVSLLSLKVERINNLNRITWTTASEQNNKGFELQRSADGRNFSTLQFVRSKAVNGISNSIIQYSFDDPKVFRGKVYYRLKQLDNDNKETYSAVVVLNGLSVTRLTIRSLYPNPAASTVNVIIAAPDAEKIDLVISDLSGKVVMRKVVDVVAGDNEADLNVSKLSSGNYMIKAVCANGCEGVSARFVKQ